MTLNDLRTKFKVIDSINAAKMAKYSLVMTPTPFVEWLDALCLLGLLIPWCTYILTYTYLHSWLGAYNTGNISETVEDKAKVTIITAYIKSYTGFRLPPKYMTFWPLSEIHGWNYTVSGKKGTNSILSITSSNTDRFSKFFHFYNLLEICNKAVVKYPIAPEMRHYTTLWNIDVRK